MPPKKKMRLSRNGRKNRSRPERRDSQRATSTLQPQANSPTASSQASGASPSTTSIGATSMTLGPQSDTDQTGGFIEENLLPTVIYESECDSDTSTDTLVPSTDFGRSERGPTGVPPVTEKVLLLAADQVHSLLRSSHTNSGGSGETTGICNSAEGATSLSGASVIQEDSSQISVNQPESATVLVRNTDAENVLYSSGTLSVEASLGGQLFSISPNSKNTDLSDENPEASEAGRHVFTSEEQSDNSLSSTTVCQDKDKNQPEGLETATQEASEHLAEATTAVSVQSLSPSAMGLNVNAETFHPRLSFGTPSRGGSSVNQSFSPSPASMNTDNNRASETEKNLLISEELSDESSSSTVVSEDSLPNIVASEESLPNIVASEETLPSIVTSKESLSSTFQDTDNSRLLRHTPDSLEFATQEAATSTMAGVQCTSPSALGLNVNADTFVPRLSSTNISNPNENVETSGSRNEKLTETILDSSAEYAQPLYTPIEPMLYTYNTTISQEPVTQPVPTYGLIHGDSIVTQDLSSLTPFQAIDTIILPYQMTSDVTGPVFAAQGANTMLGCGSPTPVLGLGQNSSPNAAFGSMQYHSPTINPYTSLTTPYPLNTYNNSAFPQYDTLSTTYFAPALYPSNNDGQERNEEGLQISNTHSSDSSTQLLQNQEPHMGVHFQSNMESVNPSTYQDSTVSNQINQDHHHLLQEGETTGTPDALVSQTETSNESVNSSESYNETKPQSQSEQAQSFKHHESQINSDNPLTDETVLGTLPTHIQAVGESVNRAERHSETQQNNTGENTIPNGNTPASIPEVYITAEDGEIRLLPDTTRINNASTTLLDSASTNESSERNTNLRDFLSNVSRAVFASNHVQTLPNELHTKSKGRNYERSLSLENLYDDQEQASDLMKDLEELERPSVIVNLTDEDNVVVDYIGDHRTPERCSNSAGAAEEEQRQSSNDTSSETSEEDDYPHFEENKTMTMRLEGRFKDSKTYSSRPCTPPLHVTESCDSNPVKSLTFILKFDRRPPVFSPSEEVEGLLAIYPTFNFRCRYILLRLRTHVTAMSIDTIKLQKNLYKDTFLVWTNEKSKIKERNLKIPFKLTIPEWTVQYYVDGCLEVRHFVELRFVACETCYNEPEYEKCIEVPTREKRPHCPETSTWMYCAQVYIQGTPYIGPECNYRPVTLSRTITVEPENPKKTSDIQTPHHSTHLVPPETSDHIDASPDVSDFTSEPSPNSSEILKSPGSSEASAVVRTEAIKFEVEGRVRRTVFAIGDNIEFEVKVKHISGRREDCMSLEYIDLRPFLVQNILMTAIATISVERTMDFEHSKSTRRRTKEGISTTFTIRLEKLVMPSTYVNLDRPLGDFKVNYFLRIVAFVPGGAENHQCVWSRRITILRASEEHDNRCKHISKVKNAPKEVPVMYNMLESVSEETDEEPDKDMDLDNYIKELRKDTVTQRDNWQTALDYLENGKALLIYHHTHMAVGPKHVSKKAPQHHQKRSIKKRLVKLCKPTEEGLDGMCDPLRLKLETRRERKVAYHYLRRRIERTQKSVKFLHGKLGILKPREERSGNKKEMRNERIGEMHERSSEVNTSLSSVGSPEGRNRSYGTASSQVNAEVYGGMIQSHTDHRTDTSQRDDCDSIRDSAPADSVPGRAVERHQGPSPTPQVNDGSETITTHRIHSSPYRFVQRIRNTEEEQSRGISEDEVNKRTAETPSYAWKVRTTAAEVFENWDKTKKRHDTRPPFGESFEINGLKGAVVHATDRSYAAEAEPRLNISLPVTAGDIDVEETVRPSSIFNNRENSHFILKIPPSQEGSKTLPDVKDHVDYLYVPVLSLFDLSISKTAGRKTAENESVSSRSSPKATENESGSSRKSHKATGNESSSSTLPGKVTENARDFSRLSGKATENESDSSRLPSEFQLGSPSSSFKPDGDESDTERIDGASNTVEKGVTETFKPGVVSSSSMDISHPTDANTGTCALSNAREIRTLTDGDQKSADVNAENPLDSGESNTEDGPLVLLCKMKDKHPTVRKKVHNIEEATTNHTLPQTTSQFLIVSSNVDGKEETHPSQGRTPEQKKVANLRTQAEDTPKQTKYTAVRKKQKERLRKIERKKAKIHRELQSEFDFYHYFSDSEEGCKVEEEKEETISSWQYLAAHGADSYYNSEYVSSCVPQLAGNNAPKQSTSHKDSESQLMRDNVERKETPATLCDFMIEKVFENNSKFAKGVVETSPEFSNDVKSSNRSFISNDYNIHKENYFAATYSNVVKNITMEDDPMAEDQEQVLQAEASEKVNLTVDNALVVNLEDVKEWPQLLNSPEETGGKKCKNKCEAKDETHCDYEDKRPEFLEKIEENSAHEDVEKTVDDKCTAVVVYTKSATLKNEIGPGNKTAETDASHGSILQLEDKGCRHKNSLDLRGPVQNETITLGSAGNCDSAFEMGKTFFLLSQNDKQQVHKRIEYAMENIAENACTPLCQEIHRELFLPMLWLPAHVTAYWSKMHPQTVRPIISDKLCMAAKEEVQDRIDAIDAEILVLNGENLSAVLEITKLDFADNAHIVFSCAENIILKSLKLISKNDTLYKALEACFKEVEELFQRLAKTVAEKVSQLEVPGFGLFSMRVEPQMRHDFENRGAISYFIATETSAAQCKTARKTFVSTTEQLTTLPQSCAVRTAILENSISETIATCSSTYNQSTVKADSQINDEDCTLSEDKTSFLPTEIVEKLCTPSSPSESIHEGTGNSISSLALVDTKTKIFSPEALKTGPMLQISAAIHCQNLDYFDKIHPELMSVFQSRLASQLMRLENSTSDLFISPMSYKLSYEEGFEVSTPHDNTAICKFQSEDTQTSVAKISLREDVNLIARNLLKHSRTQYPHGTALSYLTTPTIIAIREAELWLHYLKSRRTIQMKELNCKKTFQLKSFGTSIMSADFLMTSWPRLNRSKRTKPLTNSDTLRAVPDRNNDAQALTQTSHNTANARKIDTESFDDYPPPSNVSCKSRLQTYDGALTRLNNGDDGYCGDMVTECDRFDNTSSDDLKIQIKRCLDSINYLSGRDWNKSPPHIERERPDILPQLRQVSKKDIDKLEIGLVGPYPADNTPFSLDELVFEPCSGYGSQQIQDPATTDCDSNTLNVQGQNGDTYPYHHKQQCQPHHYQLNVPERLIREWNQNPVSINFEKRFENLYQGSTFENQVQCRGLHQVGNFQEQQRQHGVQETQHDHPHNHDTQDQEDKNPQQRQAQEGHRNDCRDNQSPQQSQKQFEQQQLQEEDNSRFQKRLYQLQQQHEQQVQQQEEYNSANQKVFDQQQQRRWQEEQQPQQEQHSQNYFYQLQQQQQEHVQQQEVYDSANQNRLNQQQLQLRHQIQQLQQHRKRQEEQQHHRRHQLASEEQQQIQVRHVSNQQQYQPLQDPSQQRKEQSDRQQEQHSQKRFYKLQQQKQEQQVQQQEYVSANQNYFNQQPLQLHQLVQQQQRRWQEEQQHHRRHQLASEEQKQIQVRHVSNQQQYQPLQDPSQQRKEQSERQQEQHSHESPDQNVYQHQQKQQQVQETQQFHQERHHRHEQQPQPLIQHERSPRQQMQRERQNQHHRQQQHHQQQGNVQLQHPGRQHQRQPLHQQLQHEQQNPMESNTYNSPGHHGSVLRHSQRRGESRWQTEQRATHSNTSPGHRQQRRWVGNSSFSRQNNSRGVTRNVQYVNQTMHQEMQRREEEERQFHNYHSVNHRSNHGYRDHSHPFHASYRGLARGQMPWSRQPLIQQPRRESHRLNQGQSCRRSSTSHRSNPN